MMRARTFALLSLAGVLLALASPAGAGEGAPPASTMSAGPALVVLAPPPTASPSSVDSTRSRRPRSAFEIDVQGVLEREHMALVALEAERARATDPALVLAVQRRIETRKQETELELLHLQATHARRAGRLEVATRIEAAIAEITQPRPQPALQLRPAPSADAGGR